MTGLSTVKRTSIVAASSGKENINSSVEGAKMVQYKEVFLNGVGKATMGAPWVMNDVLVVQLYNLPNININGQMLIELVPSTAAWDTKPTIKIKSQRRPEPFEVAYATDLWPYVCSMAKDVLWMHKDHEMLKGVDLDGVPVKTSSNLWSKHTPNLYEVLGADPVGKEDMEGALGDTYFNVTLELPNPHGRNACLFKLGNNAASVDEFVEFMNSQRAKCREVTAWVSAAATSVIYNKKNNTVRTKLVARKVQVFDLDGLMELVSDGAGSEGEGGDVDMGQAKRAGTPMPGEDKAKMLRM